MKLVKKYLNQNIFQSQHVHETQHNEAYSTVM